MSLRKSLVFICLLFAACQAGTQKQTVQPAQPKQDFLIANMDNAPPKWRVNGPFANIPEFYEAFGVTAGKPMWLPDEAHVHIW